MADRTKLEEIRARLDDGRHVCDMDIRYLLDLVDELGAMLELAKNLYHSPSCDGLTDFDAECTCGYVEFLKCAALEKKP